MRENGHITIELNDQEVSPEELDRIDEPRPRSRSRNRSSSRSPSPSISRSRREVQNGHGVRDASPITSENGIQKLKLNGRDNNTDDDDENDGENILNEGLLKRTEQDDEEVIIKVNGNGSKIGGFFSRFRGTEAIEDGEIRRRESDLNVYQHKKTLAQGFMDLALLSANANQLRYVLESQGRHPYYHFSLVFIIASLIIQVIVGVGLIMNSQYNVKKEEDYQKADRINNLITAGILLITIINVFVSAFGVAENA